MKAGEPAVTGDVEQGGSGGLGRKSDPLNSGGTRGEGQYV
jgi:hypothetical protein